MCQTLQMRQNQDRQVRLRCCFQHPMSMMPQVREIDQGQSQKDASRTASLAPLRGRCACSDLLSRFPSFHTCLFRYSKSMDLTMAAYTY